MIAGLNASQVGELALLLVAVGALSGFLGGVFGIGGGAVLVPVFYECFRLAGVPIDVLPGPSAATSVALLSGFSLRRFTFEGFPPRAASARRARFAAALLAGAYVALALLAPAQAAGQDTIEIVSASGVHAFTVELAANDPERERGLMFRKELPEGQGMLFDFQHDQPVAFWMHNTYISLDMIFIRGDGRIARIEDSAKPESDRLIPSGAPVRAVLEVIAGTASRLGIKPGDRVVGSIFGKGR